MYLAGRLLRGQGSFTSIFRAVGFAYGVYLLDLFSLIGPIAPIVKFIVSLLAIFAVWIGVATGHQLKGWRTLILPVFYLLVLITGFVIIFAFVGSFAVSIESILSDFGLQTVP